MTPVQVIAGDIEKEWRPLSAAEQDIIPGKSQSAWERLKSKRPDLEESIAAGEITEDAVKAAMVSMIIRVLKNPDSARSVSTAYDDWSKSQTLDTTVSTGELYVNDHELDLITPASQAPEYGAYTVPFWG